jgi:hypothetical protein
MCYLFWYIHSSNRQTIFAWPMQSKSSREVAILPVQDALSEKVRKIAIVAFVESALIELNNVGLYFVANGKG